MTGGHMMKPTTSTKEHTIGHARMYHWQEVTPGERFIIRTPSGDTNGLYSMLEVISDPRNGVPSTSMKMKTNISWSSNVRRASRSETSDRTSRPARLSPFRRAYRMPGVIDPILQCACWCFSARRNRRTVPGERRARQCQRHGARRQIRHSHYWPSVVR